MAVDGKPVLLMATPQRLIVIEVNNLKINHYKDERELKIDHHESRDFEIHPLPVFKMLNLVKGGFPFGMRFFVRDSKLYMVGGEKPRGKPSLEWLPFYRNGGHDKSFGDRGLSPFVYVLDLDSITTTTGLDLRQHHISLLAAKPAPIVEEIEGKIYVLSGTPWQSYCFLPEPTFEVYDPSSIERQKLLPEPPFHRIRFFDSQAFEINYHSVEGNTLHVETSSSIDLCDHYYSYNVNEGIWKESGSSSDDSPIPYHFTPSCGIGKFVPAYNKEIFIYFKSNRPFAALIPSNYDSPIRYQALTEVDGGLYRRQVVSSSQLVVELGEHEMCIIQPGSVLAKDEVLAKEVGRIPSCRTILYMATFSVKKLLHSSSSVQGRGLKLLKTTDASDVSQTSSHHDYDVEDNRAPFLSITCLSKGFYALDEWGPEAPYICSAFFHQLSTHKTTDDGEVCLKRL